MRRRQNRGAFTLIEIAIAILILLLILMIGVPSMTGVMADRRLRRSLDDLNTLVRTAQERAVMERRPYLIVWEKERLLLRPETFTPEEDESAAVTLPMQAGDALLLKLPAALTEEVAPEWVFWPSGTCEPAEISFKGVDGTWSATYSMLTARPEITSYAAR